ncbi:MAG TPA: efflux RND transporter periplasmic adaptor subunit [Thermoanaerobaculia bacterium]|nr:efflux RND transporter periplasmic adaptor subunit [Thermoanaerobaculia bacterium]
MHRRYVSSMKKAAAATALAGLLVVAGACAGDGRPDGEPLLTSEAGELSWKLWLDPDPPRQKGNTVWIRAQDAAGEPVEGAEVTLEYLMPAMGAMAEMRGEGEVGDEGDGFYRIGLDFPMGGTWRLTLTVAGDGARASAEYSLTVGSGGLREMGATGGGSAGSAGAATIALKIAPLELPGPALEALRTALAAYEQTRELLAGDRLDGLDARAARLAQSFDMAEQALADGTPSEVAQCLIEAAEAARAMATASDLGTARQAFGEVSRFLIALAGADARLAEEWHVFECPMTQTFPKWMQPEAELENPYMGTAMTTCGAATDWTVPAPASLAELEGHVENAHGGDVAYYTCSMHSSVKSETPGTCPICSMGLVPVTREELETGVIRVDAQRRQEIGVRTAPVEARPVETTIRAVGTVTYDETKLSAVSLKYEGWIERLYVAETGQPVSRGQPLLALYSPALLSAQEELLIALASQSAARETELPQRADYLVAAARRRLSLWDLSARQIDEIARTGQPVKSVPVFSPVSGFVVEKNVVEGQAVKPGETLYRIAGLDRVWIDAEVYESELPLVQVGQLVEVTLPYLPSKSFSGRVGYIYPYLEGGTRTGKVRVELPNPELELKPEMYANVVFRVKVGERVVVPEEAVIYAGPRRLVFVDLGEGRLQPREIEVGLKVGDAYEVLSGLREGEVVVTSGNFLIAAESRLKSATEKW